MEKKKRFLDKPQEKDLRDSIEKVKFIRNTHRNSNEEFPAEVLVSSKDGEEVQVKKGQPTGKVQERRWCLTENIYPRV